MSHIRSTTIAIISESSHDDGYSSRTISFIDDLFDFEAILSFSGSSLDRTLDDISSDSLFSCCMDSIGETAILGWVRSFFCGDSDELRVKRIDLRFCFGIFLFRGCYDRSTSHKRKGYIDTKLSIYHAQGLFL
jgi:hypothetical protein